MAKLSREGHQPAFIISSSIFASHSRFCGFGPLGPFHHCKQSQVHPIGATVKFRRMIEFITGKLETWIMRVINEGAQVHQRLFDRQYDALKPIQSISKLSTSIMAHRPVDGHSPQLTLCIFLMIPFPPKSNNISGFSGLDFYAKIAFHAVELISPSVICQAISFSLSGCVDL